MVTMALLGCPPVGVHDCKVLDLRVKRAAEGNLAFIEGSRDVPFDIARVYYLYDVPGGASRGGHAHRSLRQLLVALSGSFEVHLDDGSEKRAVTLNRPDRGLYVEPMIWRELVNFSSGAVCVVLASDYYDEGDYYRDYSAFQEASRASRDAAPTVSSTA
jgi:WxcM-like, C-terminal